MAEGRLFFALWPDPAVRDQLAALAGQFSPQGGRPHHPQDLHLTLVFLGQVADERLPCVLQAGEAQDTAAISLRLDTLGHWHRPGILWAGPSLLPDELSSLVSSLQKGLQTCGFEPERRSFKPHVTLHRKIRHAEKGRIEQPISWQAQSFVLATSGGGAQGQPRYRILHRWDLK